MSRCGRTSQLESLLSHESPELRTHARTCAVCRHELNWLESEATLFRQRAGRDEVAHLWAGVQARSKPVSHPWPKMFAALAAAAALLLVTAPSRRVAVTDEEPLESDALMSPVLSFDEPCSRLPSGMGFTCQPSVLASR
jgi:hypothetical protein